MTHLPFVAISYGLAVLIPIFFAIQATRRLAQARQKLAALETRRRRR